MSPVRAAPSARAKYVMASVNGNLVGFTPLFCYLGRTAIGRDRVFPSADTGKDVRGHVQRVRRRRRDAGVAAGGGQALLGNGRCVVAMDQVMRHARMIGVLDEEVF